MTNSSNSQDSEADLRRQYKKNKLNATRCFALIVMLMIALCIGICMAGFINYYFDYNYGKVFKKIEVVSRFDKDFLFHQVDVKLRHHKHFKIQHNLIPSKLEAKRVSDTIKDENFLEKFDRRYKNVLKSLGHMLDYDSKDESFLKIIEKKKFHFKIKKSDTKANEQIECFNINVTDSNKNYKTTNEVEACMDLGTDAWFGGHESYSQPYWPINNQSFDYVAYETGFPDQWAAVFERYWISSSGIAVYIDEDIPLFVKHLEPGKICFKTSNNTAPYIYTPIYDKNSLIYTMCVGPDIKSTHMHMIENFLGKPSSVPDLLMMKSPIWTTWNYFFRHINSTVVLDFANQIVLNNYTRSQLEIDDQWEDNYGDLDFSKTSFPNVKDLTNKLHNLGFRVTLWVHPFCNIDSYNFVPGAYKGLWVKDQNGQLPAFTSWWNGNTTAIVDLTNSDAVQYFSGKLNYLRKNYGIDSFKFDAGESSWLPSQFSFNDRSKRLSFYSQSYVNVASAINNFIEVRTATRIQNKGLFFRILDRSSDWTINDGLKSVITETLQFGLLGYPFVLPDMIGGNSGPDKSQKELFIRWTELNAFLPAMQFGVPPWYFDKETNDICRYYVNLRESLVYPYLVELAKKLDGQPLIRPLWWLEPTNMAIFRINDQFLVGDQILVAPILDPGVSSRNIYIPPGSWLHYQSKINYTGPYWITMNVNLSDIPFFLYNGENSRFKKNLNLIF